MSKPPVPPVPAAPAKPDDKYVEALNGFRQDLIRVVFKISENSQTSTRAVLDGFGKRISPSMADQGEAAFTFNPRPHFRDNGRTSNTGRTAIMLSLVGIAVLDYYRAVKAPTEKTCEALLKKLILLTAIATDGLDKFAVEGNDGFGFTLVRAADGTR